MGVRGVTIDEVTQIHCWTLRLWVQKILDHLHYDPSKLCWNILGMRYLFCVLM